MRKVKPRPKGDPVDLDSPINKKVRRLIAAGATYKAVKNLMGFSFGQTGYRTLGKPRKIGVPEVHASDWRNGTSPAFLAYVDAWDKLTPEQNKVIDRKLGLI
jgi:hypothetical protein